MRYIVTGIAQICIYSQWSERHVCVEVRGVDAGAAKALALELEKRTAERQDPQATVKWFEQPQIEEIGMPVTANDLATALRTSLERGPTPEAHWTLIRWEAQHDSPDAGRGLARLLHRDYHYTIGQLAQLSEFDRRTMAAALVRYFQTYRAGEDLTASMVLAGWQIAIDRQVARQRTAVEG